MHRGPGSLLPLSASGGTGRSKLTLACADEELWLGAIRLKSRHEVFVRQGGQLIFFLSLGLGCIPFAGPLALASLAGLESRQLPVHGGERRPPSSVVGARFVHILAVLSALHFSRTKDRARLENAVRQLFVLPPVHCAVAK